MSLIKELKRRNVFRMAVVYAIAAWVIMQVAEVLNDLANLPDWIGPTILGLLAVGFPIALILSWFFALTPAGISLEKDVDPAEPITHMTGRRLNFIVISLLSAAIILFAYDKWWTRGPSEQSIAVLPFENMSDDANEQFTNGMHDDLMTRLSRIGALKVISRTSVLGYRDTTKSIPEIADELNVATILEGGVQRVGNRVRINAQLIDAETDEHLWVESFDRELTIDNIFAIQSEIAELIANALRTELSLEEQQRLEEKPTDNLQAYQAYLLGRQYMAKRTSTDLEEAKTHFERAIELDPDYVLAYVGLADTYNHLSGYGSLSEEDAITLAKPLVEQALELDDQSGEAYTSLGVILFNQDKNAAAEEAYRRAIELNPNYADAYHYYSHMLMLRGRPDEALPLRRKAVELDPMSTVVNMNLAQNLGALGRFDEAREVYQHTTRIAPDSPGAYSNLGGFEYWTLGNVAVGARHIEEAASLDPGNPNHPAFLAGLYMDLGDVNTAHARLERARQLNPDNWLVVIVSIAINVYEEDWPEAFRYSKRMLSIDPTNSFALSVLAWDDASTGSHERALERYREAVPELLTSEPEVTAVNYPDAIEIASLLIDTGEHERAEQLLDGGLEVIQGLPRLGLSGYKWTDAVIYTLKGDTNRALEALREGVDANLRVGWRIGVGKNYHLEPLHDDPRYQRIIAELETDMAAQLASLDESDAASF